MIHFPACCLPRSDGSVATEKVDIEATTTRPSTSTASITRHKPNSLLIRDTIIGFADGLTVPFALTAGLSSLGSTKIVILGGLAELFAGSISMGLGAYLAAVTERKHYQVVEARERLQLSDREESVYKMFARYEIGRAEAEGVVEALKKGGEASWIRFIMDFQVRLEKPESGMAVLEGLVMGVSYCFGGLLPLIPYFVAHHILDAFYASIGITSIILLGFGYVKARTTACSQRDSAVSAVQTLFIGAAAAGVSYGIVRGMNSIKLLQDQPLTRQTVPLPTAYD